MEFPLTEIEHIALELTRPVTQGTEVSNDNKSKEEDSTEVTDGKLNGDTEEKIGMSMIITWSWN